ncbi:uncharacterized protein LOC143019042 [Oratosquilla oratoria]|uniref:uncharacterized protein LOC143019042 n=1 Tax=Oratosquilla oratoria TaxID=337810 RepID=UPI003F75C150
MHKCPLHRTFIQQHDTKPGPIAYAIRTLNKQEQNYSATDIEVLVVVYTLKHFKEIILGYDIHVYKDHRPILQLFIGKIYQENLLAVTDIEALVVVHTLNHSKEILGKVNLVADALSRHIATINKNPISITLTQEHIAAAQRSDPLWKHIIYVLESADTNVTDNCPPNINNYTLVDDVHHKTTLTNKHEPNRSVFQLIVPADLIPEVLEILHDWGHCRIRWQGEMRYTNQIAILLTTHEEGYTLLHRCISLLSVTQSSYQWSCMTAQYVTQTLVNEIICLFTAPKYLISDYGTEVNNEILSNVYKSFQISKCNTTAYHTSNGLVEYQN